MLEIALKEENLCSGDKSDENDTNPVQISLPETLGDEEFSCKEDNNGPELDALKDENSCSDVGKVLFSRKENTSSDNESSFKESDNEVPKEISSPKESSAAVASQDARQPIDPKQLAPYDGYGLSEEVMLSKAKAFEHYMKGEKLAEVTRQAIKKASAIEDCEIFGRHTFCSFSYQHEKEFKRTFRKTILITPLCTSIDALDSDKEPKRREIKRFTKHFKEFVNETYKHKGKEDPEAASWFQVFRIMLPHDFPPENYKDFLKGFLELTPYEEGMAFFAGIMVMGNARFMMLYINNRQYYKKMTEIPVCRAKKDTYYNKKTGHTCKADDPDAVLKYEKGHVIRTIRARFGSRIPFTMNKSDYLEMHEKIKEYMNNYFDECGCTVDNTVLLARLEGDELKEFNPIVRHRNAEFNHVYIEKERLLTSVLSIISTYNNPILNNQFKAAVQNIRNWQYSKRKIYVPEPGYPSHKMGKVTISFGGSYKSFRQNISILKGFLQSEIERFLENLSVPSCEDEMEFTS